MRGGVGECGDERQACSVQWYNAKVGSVRVSNYHRH